MREEVFISLMIFIGLLCFAVFMVSLILSKQKKKPANLINLDIEAKNEIKTTKFYKGAGNPKNWTKAGETNVNDFAKRHNAIEEKVKEAKRSIESKRSFYDNSDDILNSLANHSNNYYSDPTPSRSYEPDSSSNNHSGGGGYNPSSGHGGGHSSYSDSHSSSSYGDSGSSSSSSDSGSSSSFD